MAEVTHLAPHRENKTSWLRLRLAPSLRQRLEQSASGAPGARVPRGATSREARRILDRHLPPLRPSA